jgi:hypothetical protein
MRNLIGKAKDLISIDFLDSQVQIAALSVSEIRKFQAKVKALNADKKVSDEDRALMIQRDLIRAAVVGASDMTDEELDTFPIKKLGELTREILSHNGLDPDKAGAAAGNDA